MAVFLAGGLNRRATGRVVGAALLALAAGVAPVVAQAADEPAIPDAGLPAETAPGLVSERTEVLEAGVAGLWPATHDSFPTTEIQVAALQEVGDVMFVGGKFTQVVFRAGGTASQSFLAAFDRDTGAWIDSFRPTLDGPVWDLAVLPDGRLAVGGQFTHVNGAADTGALAFIDPTTGAVTGEQVDVYRSGSSRRPLVRGMDVDDGYLYFGGNFTRVVGADGVQKSVGQVAKIRLSDGHVMGSWLPNVGGIVFGLDADGDRVYIVGNFHTVNGSSRPGLGIVWSGNGALVPNQAAPVRNHEWTYQHDVLVVDDVVWEAGSNHLRNVYERDGFDNIVTWESRSGDGQAIAELNGVVYTGSHTAYFWDATYYPFIAKFTGVGGTRVQHTDWTFHKFMGAFSPDGDIRHDWVPQIGSSTGEGSWALFADSTDCLWTGGDFHRGSYDGNTARFVRGFAKFCGADQTPPAPPTAPTAEYTEGEPLGASPGTPFECLAVVPNDVDGRYWFDFGNGPFEASVDSSEGGAWVLLLQYQRAGGTNPALDVRTRGENWPAESATAHGTDESGTASWGHTGQAAASAIPDAAGDLELRWYSESSGHGRVVHFRSPVLGELQSNARPSFYEGGIATNYTALGGHTGVLPASANNGFHTQGDLALTEFPFYRGGTHHWGVRGLSARWESDDYVAGSPDSTFHQVWVRSDGAPCDGDVGASGVRLSWTASTGDNFGGGVTYEVLKNDRVIASYLTGTTYFDRGGTVDDRYFVRTVDRAGNKSATTRVFGAGATPDTTPPTTPHDLAASVDAAVDPDDVTLSWTASTDDVGVVEYQILRNGAEIGRTATTSFTMVDAPEGDSWFQVRAFDAAGNQSFKTSPVKVTITLPGADTSPPSTPQNLVGTANGDGDIELTWSAASDDVGVVDYVVYRNGQVIMTVTETNAVYADAPVGNNWMQVRARDAAGNEGFKTSPIVVVVDPAPVADTTPPSTPQHLTGEIDAAAGTATLTWAAATDDVGVDAYRVLRNGVEVAVVDGATTTATVDAQRGGNWYQVRAVDAAGNEGFKTPPLRLDL